MGKKECLLLQVQKPNFLPNNANNQVNFFFFTNYEFSKVKASHEANSNTNKDLSLHKRLPFHIKSKLHKPKNIYKKNLVQLHTNITKSNKQALEQKTPNNEIPNIISHTQKHDQNTHQTMNNMLRKKIYYYKVNQIRTKLMGFYLEIDIFLTILSADEYWCKARNSHPHDQNLHFSLELLLIFLCTYVLYWPSSLMEISVFFFFKAFLLSV